MSVPTGNFFNLFYSHLLRIENIFVGVQAELARLAFATYIQLAFNIDKSSVVASSRHVFYNWRYGQKIDFLRLIRVVGLADT